MKTSEKLKKKRKEFDYSFKELSDLTKIPITTLSAYERGAVKNISHENLKILSTVFFTDINYFLLDDEEKSLPQKAEKKIKRDVVNSLSKFYKNMLKDLKILEDKKVEELFKYIKNFIEKNEI
ncbi:helix-turn-helix domain-containing protein [Streptobacillus moniliformis]|uniref:helix-turn-helix domain-containing protein n=1 Tax=Streptobacillus moniliformis TaxID=34105 RepID=UPI0007E418C1|nr:helix-turn-helix transcriptional regulator [Streptobacillus moniliformis]